MNLKRAAAFGATGAVVAAMIAGATTGVGRPPIVVPDDRPAAVELRGAELAAEIAKLRERLRPTTMPHQPARNLFRFSAAQPMPTPTRGPAIGAEPAYADTLTPSPAPSLTLIGIAEDATGIRTAILSASGELLHVKEGEPVPPRYRVARIAANAVDLISVVEGAAANTSVSDTPALRLALK